MSAPHAPRRAKDPAKGRPDNTEEFALEIAITAAALAIDAVEHARQVAVMRPSKAASK